MKLFEFKQVMDNILKQHKQDKEVFEIIINFVKDENNEEEVLFEKLNTLIEVF